MFWPCSFRRGLAPHGRSERSTRAGFTLIEALLSVSIIGALSVIVFSSVNVLDILAKTRNARRAAHINDLLTAISAYTVEQNGTLPPQVTLPPVPGPTTFSGAHIIGNLSGARTVAIADFDGDGDQDVASATEAGAGEVSVWQRGGTSPSLTWTKSVVEAGFKGWELAAADIDKDGKTDILAVSKSGKKISWWRNLGGASLTFGARVDIDAAYKDPRTVVAVDIDADTNIDVVAASDKDKSIQWWRNNGSPLTGGWSTSDIESQKKKVTEIVAADLDGDGDQDIVGGYKDDLSLWIHPANPLSTPWTRYDIDSTQKKTEGTFIADMDGDGDRDVLAISKSSVVSFWENDGNIQKNNWIEHSIATNFGGDTIAAADADGDGDLDVIGGSQGGDKLVWWQNRGVLGFSGTSVIESGTEANGIQDLALADIDGDADTDIVAAMVDGGTVSWWENLRLSGISQSAPSANISTAFKPVCQGQVTSVECDANGGVSLNVLVPNYIESIPIDPSGSGAVMTGYEIHMDASAPVLYLRAANAELSKAIELKGIVGVQNCLVWDILSGERTCMVFQ